MTGQVTEKTWREVLADAQDGIARAKASRREVFERAHDAGLSMRQIAEATGISAAGVSRILGPRVHTGRVALDDPTPDVSREEVR